MINTGLLSAVRTWWRVANAGQRARGVGVLVLLVCVAIGCGGAASLLVHPRVVTITKTETKTVDHIVYQDRIIEKAAQVVYKDRIITHTEFDPACNGKVASVTVEEDKTSDTSTKNTDTTVASTENKATDTKSETVTKPADIPRVFGGVGLGLQPLRPAGAIVLLDFDVRPLSFLPLTVGVWSTIPALAPQEFVIGLKAGVQW